MLCIYCGKEENHMIKQITFQPVDTSYVPGEPTHWFAHASVNDTHGGQTINIAIDLEAANDLKWLRQHRKREEAEAKARTENPALASAYEQYRVTIGLVLDQI